MAAAQTAERRLRIGIIHPDLGIGGAERLVVDAAVGLTEAGHDVEIFTSYHDPKHCFEATRDGTLKVHVVKTMFPRSLAGSLHSVFAILQAWSLVTQLLISLLYFSYPGTFPRFVHNLLSSSPPQAPFDVVFMDQQSFGVPFIKLLGWTRVVFYCHFPDKDISNSIAKQRAISRGESGPSALRNIYRLPLNLIEEGTMSYADKILVNSEFTQQHFRKSFYRLRRIPRVLYPGIDMASYEPAAVERALAIFKAERGPMSTLQQGVVDIVTDTSRPTVISINRFEAKKNVELALESFAAAQKDLAAQGSTERYRLVIAGGYDRRVKDNIATLDELQKLASKLGLVHTVLFFDAPMYEPPMSLPPKDRLDRLSVIFLPSLPGPLLHSLLINPSTLTLLYTPTDEHFGIVPLEAMACGIPILATNTGGPKESILDAGLDLSSSSSEGGVSRPTFTAAQQGTGLLRHPSAKVWATALTSLLTMSPATRIQFSTAAKSRVKESFTKKVMVDQLQAVLQQTEAMGPVASDEGLMQWGSSLAVFVLMMAGYVWMCTAR